MKKLLFLFLLSTNTFAQVFRIDSLPKEGILEVRSVEGEGSTFIIKLEA